MSDTEERYEGAAGGHEYKADMDKAVLFCQVLITLPVEKMANHLEHVHAVAPILDPTAYRNGMDNLEQQAAVVRALGAALRELRREKKLYAAFVAASSKGV